ncbi:MAG: 23S rRNA (guanosine(2251)-2'-O)-methyltransferase RlmB [Bacteroidota bacterium]
MKSTKDSRNSLIYGVHPVVEALASGSSLDKIFIRRGNEHGRIGEVRKLAKEKGIPVQFVPEEKLRRLVKDPEARHQGIVAQVSNIPYQELETVILGLEEQAQVPLFVLLDGVTDVRNFGAIARTAECMGAQAIIVPATGSAPMNGDAVKTSAGALYHLPVCRVDHLVDAILLLQAYGIRSVACTERAAGLVFEEDLTQPTCLLLGSEEKGISDSLLKRCEAQAKVPLQGKVASLNVSVAAGMVLLEAMRQRKG